MKNILLLALSTSLLQAVNYNNSTGDLLYDDGAGSTLPYRLFLPQGYDPNVKYPIVVFYHGAGQRGSNNLIAGGHAENVYQATQGNFGAQFKAFHLVPHVPPISAGSNSTGPRSLTPMRKNPHPAKP
ncbi:MAG: hypothetical protein ABF377_14335 [Akkermansiaceae bacterium]